jgi:hypothetical protein
MSIKYKKIKKSPIIFNCLFGVSVSQFEYILLKIEPEWQKQMINAYKRPGQDYKLERSDMLLLLLVYYRNFISQIVTVTSAKHMELNSILLPVLLI